MEFIVVAVAVGGLIVIGAAILGVLVTATVLFVKGFWRGLKEAFHGRSKK